MFHQSLNPSFASTSPFYLKASIAALHILSIYLVLFSTIPSSHEPELNASSSNHKSSKSSNPVVQPPMQTVKHSTNGKEEESLWTDAMNVAEIMFNATMEHVTYFPSFLFAKNSKQHGNAEGNNAKDTNGKEDFFTVHVEQESSSNNWWIEFMRSCSMHFIMYHITGHHAFTYLPIWCCLFCLVSAAVPSITSFTKYRESVVAIVLPTMVYLISAMHLSALVFTQYRDCGSISWHLQLMTTSAFVLHTSAHAMFQCVHTYQSKMANKKIFLSGSVMFFSACGMCMLSIAWFALATPAVIIDVTASLKDMIVIHAITAFLPECLGVIFMGALKMIQKLVDREDHEKCM